MGVDLVAGLVAIDTDAGADHIQVRFGQIDRCTGVGAVDDRNLDAGIFKPIAELHETIQLGQDETLVGAVGGGGVSLAGVSESPGNTRADRRVCFFPLRRWRTGKHDGETKAVSE